MFDSVNIKNKRKKFLESYHSCKILSRCPICKKPITVSYKGQQYIDKTGFSNSQGQLVCGVCLYETENFVLRTKNFELSRYKSLFKDTWSLSFENHNRINIFSSANTDYEDIVKTAAIIIGA